MRTRLLTLVLVAALGLAGCGGGGESKPAAKTQRAVPVAHGPGPGARALQAAAEGDRALLAMTCEALEQGNDYFDIRSNHLDQASFVARYKAKYEPRYGSAAGPAATKAYSLLKALEERDMDRVSLALRCLNTAAPSQ